jgi:hypothetical protein
MTDKKITDSIGNELNAGDMVYIYPRPGDFLIGFVKGVDPGGMQLISKKFLPGKVRMTFDITLELDPNFLRAANVLRVIDPRSETVIRKILEGQEASPPAS